MSAPLTIAAVWTILCSDWNLRLSAGPRPHHSKSNTADIQGRQTALFNSILGCCSAPLCGSSLQQKEPPWPSVVFANGCCGRVWTLPFKTIFWRQQYPRVTNEPLLWKEKVGTSPDLDKNFRIFVIVVITIYVPGRYAYTAECTWSSSSGSPWRGSPSLLRAGVYDPSSVLLRQPNSWSDLVCACGNFERQPTYENKTELNLSTVQLWNKI